MNIDREKIKEQLRNCAIRVGKLPYYDTEDSHIAADGILCNLLIKLGYKDVVDEWKNLDKWYA